jgi:hypothetical protein
MTPKPSSSSDGSALPPRHRPTLGNLAKDTTEMDLWAFEDDLDSPDEPQAPELADGSGALPSDPPRPASKIIPSPREFQGKPAAREIDDRPLAATPAAREELIRRNVEKIRSTIRPATPPPPPTGHPLPTGHPVPAGHSVPESDFDELDDWEDSIPQPAIASRASAVSPEASESPIQADSPSENRVPDETDSAAPGPARERTENEFSPIPIPGTQPVSLRPHLGLTNVERIGLIALGVMLLAAVVAVLVFSFSRLPTESLGDHEIDYPVKGSYLTVDSARTYWRKPITDGPNPDTVRRDTELLPVLELDITGGPAVIRVLFRNDERAVVGDAVMHMVTGSGTLKIPATAGFEDYGMYAAYTTGQGPPWTIEIHEAKAEGAAGDEFKKLFELNISIDRR